MFRKGCPSEYIRRYVYLHLKIIKVHKNDEVNKPNIKLYKYI